MFSLCLFSLFFDHRSEPWAGPQLGKPEMLCVNRMGTVNGVCTDGSKDWSHLGTDFYYVISFQCSCLGNK